MKKSVSINREARTVLTPHIQFLSMFNKGMLFFFPCQNSSVKNPSHIFKNVLEECFGSVFTKHKMIYIKCVSVK